MKNRKTRTGKKIFPLFLSAAMLFTLQGVPVPAKAADVAELSEQTKMAGKMPSDPVHHCINKDINYGVDKDKDWTDWSYVYFGSYPQTQLKREEITDEIINAAYDVNGDAWINGTKYRRIDRSNTNHIHNFGNSTYCYFKWERIRWRVLSMEGDTMFVMADKALDCKNYNEERAFVTWESCMLRKWLNHDFFETAFSSDEQKAIVTKSIANDDNPEYGTDGGKDTTDNVYLLSFSEAKNERFGFCRMNHIHSASRKVSASDYAHRRGVKTAGGSDNHKDDCWWFLRSPGGDPSMVSGIHTVGYLTDSGTYVDDKNKGCVPVVHIDLSSDRWSITDDGTSGEGGGDRPAEPVTITPKSTSIKGEIKAKKKAFLVSWKKQKSATGYQIQYATNKKFTKKMTKTRTVKGASKTKLTVKKLKGGRKYYVRIRVVQKVNGKSYYSKWSKVKTVKTKK